MNDDSSGHRLICEGNTHEVQPTIYYIWALIGAVMGIPVLFASLPLLRGQRSGDWEGGLAGTAIGIICCIGCFLALRAARSKTAVFRVHFYDNGFDFQTAGTGSRFLKYDEIVQMAVVLHIPSSTRKAISVATGVTSLVTLNARGLYRAFSQAQSIGAVVLKVSEKVTLFVPKISIESASRIAEVASELRGEQLLVHQS